MTWPLRSFTSTTPTGCGSATLLPARRNTGPCNLPPSRLNSRSFRNASYNRGVDHSSTAAETAQPVSGPRQFSLWQRFLVWLFGWAGYLLVSVLGPTLRYTVSIEEGGPRHWYIAPAIYPFWHQCLIPACYWWRNKQISVLTSASFDGEYTARMLERFGYRTVRGSSTRGGVRGLLGLQNELDSGYAISFTIDGPKGPAFVAKPGPVLVAKNTGLPIVCFHVGLEKPWIFQNAWDQFMVPRPFSRALVRIGKLIYVPPDARELEPYHAEMQATLERVKAYAEQNVGRSPADDRRPTTNDRNH
jgi:lysophospholipid acyltransferase (LPLAT)-like uncharacterized protein